GVQLVDGAERDVDEPQQRAHRDPVGARVVPLVRAEVEVEDDLRTAFPGALGREQRRAPGGLAAEVGAGDLQDADVLERQCEHVVDRQLGVRTVVAVEDERKPVGRLDPEQDRARAPARLSQHPARLDAVLLQEPEHEVADGVVADPRQQRRSQPEPPPADADVRRRAADVRREAGDLRKRRADVGRVEVDRRATYVQRVVARHYRLRACRWPSYTASYVPRGAIASPISSALTPRSRSRGKRPLSDRRPVTITTASASISCRPSAWCTLTSETLRPSIASTKWSTTISTPVS